MEPPGQGDHDGRLVEADGVDRLSLLERQVRELTARLAAHETAPSLSATDPKLADRLGDRVDVLTERMDTLSEIARSASGAVVARETELAAVRHDLGELRVRVEGAVADLHHVDRAPVEALQRTVSALSTDVAALRQGQERLEEQLASLASAGEEAGAALTGHERSLAELRADVEATGVRMDSVVAVVRDAVESLLSQVGPGEAPVADGGLSDRLEELTRRVDDLARRLSGDEVRPRLVTWGAPAADAHASEDVEDVAVTRDGGDASHDTVAPTLADASLDPTGVESETRESIASLGGGR